MTTASICAPRRSPLAKHPPVPPSPDCNLSPLRSLEPAAAPAYLSVCLRPKAAASTTARNADRACCTCASCPTAPHPPFVRLVACVLSGASHEPAALPAYPRMTRRGRLSTSRRARLTDGHGDGRGTSLLQATDGRARRDAGSAVARPQRPSIEAPRYCWLLPALRALS